MTNEYNIRLNPNRANVIDTGLKFAQGDKGIILNLAIDELDTSNTTAKIVFKRSNGTSVESNITGEGIYRYQLLGNELAVMGKVVTDLKFYEDGKRISTCTFVFEVTSDTMDGIGEGTGGYSDRLEQLVTEAEEATAMTEQAKEELQSTQKDMEKTVQDFKTAYGEVGALNPRGDWKSESEYQIRDMVYHNSSTWICLAMNTGKEPCKENKAYWMKSTDTESIDEERLKSVEDELSKIVSGEKTVANATNAENASKLGGLTAEEFVSNENLLVNPDFKINTNGLTKYEPSSGYLETVDKWEIENGVMYGGTAEVVENGIKLTNVKSESTTYLTQFLHPTDEFKSQLNKRIFTLSAEIDDVVYSLTSGTACGVYSRVIPDGKIFFYKNNNGDKFDFAVRIDTMNGTSKVIKWVKLELGSVATPFAPPNPEVEKLKCGVANADTLDGYHASEFDKLIAVESTDTLVNLWNSVPDSGKGRFIYLSGIPSDFPTDLGNPYRNGYMSVEIKKVNGVGYYILDCVKTNGVPFVIVGYCPGNATISWRRIANANDFLPLTGGTVNGFVDIASEYGIANTVTDDDTNKTYTFMFKANKSGECTIYSFDKSANKTLNTIWLSKGGGLYHMGYDGVSWNTILDTGNSKPVAIQETAPSDTSALWAW